MSFDPDVYLVKKDRAAALKAGPLEAVNENGGEPAMPTTLGSDEAETGFSPRETSAKESRTNTLLLTGSIPPESWNKVGTRLIPKLRAGNKLTVGVTFSVEIGETEATYLLRELEQILADLNLADKIKIESK